VEGSVSSDTRPEACVTVLAIPYTLSPQLLTCISLLSILTIHTFFIRKPTIGLTLVFLRALFEVVSGIFVCFRLQLCFGACFPPASATRTVLPVEDLVYRITGHPRVCSKFLPLSNASLPCSARPEHPVWRRSLASRGGAHCLCRP